MWAVPLCQRKHRLVVVVVVVVVVGDFGFGDFSGIYDSTTVPRRHYRSLIGSHTLSSSAC